MDNNFDRINKKNIEIYNKKVEKLELMRDEIKNMYKKIQNEPAFYIKFQLYGTYYRKVADLEKEYKFLEKPKLRYNTREEAVSYMKMLKNIVDLGIPYIPTYFYC